jgi:HD-GYP domain-containing protein (c-di-GMP phosphodiesterase class II)
MNYTPLRISTIKPLRNLNFELYIFFKEQYLKYSEKGEQIPEEKYKKLREQKIAKFYILDHDEPEYRQFIDDLLKETIKDPNVKLEDKLHISEGAATTAMERMQEDPGNIGAYKMTQSAAKGLRAIVEGNPEALKNIFGRKANDSEMLTKHSLNVCALSTKLAKLLKHTEEEIDNIATAALLHDIGITKLKKEEQDLFKKDVKKFTMDDKRVYGIHVKNVTDILNEKPYVNKEIIALITSHEEKLSGAGPLRLKKLTPLQEILSLVNSYDKRVSVQGKTAVEAIKEIQIDELGNYTLDLLKSFKKILSDEGLI